MKGCVHLAARASLNALPCSGIELLCLYETDPSLKSESFLKKG